MNELSVEEKHDRLHDLALIYHQDRIVFRSKLSLLNEMRRIIGVPTKRKLPTTYHYVYAIPPTDNCDWWAIVSFSSRDVRNAIKFVSEASNADHYSTWMQDFVAPTRHEFIYSEAGVQSLMLDRNSILLDSSNGQDYRNSSFARLYNYQDQRYQDRGFQYLRYNAPMTSAMIDVYVSLNLTQVREAIKKYRAYSMPILEYKLLNFLYNTDFEYDRDEDTDRLLRVSR